MPFVSEALYSFEQTRMFIAQIEHLTLYIAEHRKKLNQTSTKFGRFTALGDATRCQGSLLIIFSTSSDHRGRRRMDRIARDIFLDTLRRYEDTLHFLHVVLWAEYFHMV